MKRTALVIPAEGAARWDDYTSSDPRNDFSEGMRAFVREHEALPNQLALGFEWWDILRRHPDTCRLAGGGMTDPIALAPFAGVRSVRILCKRSEWRDAYFELVEDA